MPASEAYLLAICGTWGTEMIRKPNENDVSPLQSGCFHLSVDKSASLCHCFLSSKLGFQDERTAASLFRMYGSLRCGQT